MKLIFKNRLFYFECSPNDKETPRRAGFKFDNAKKIWWTDAHHVALRLVDFADATAKSEISQVCTVTTPVQLERVEFPDHLRPKDYQVQAVLYALARSKAYLGLDPGLGKTICSAIIHNSSPATLVVIAPPFLLFNWEFELKKWSTRPLNIVALTPKTDAYAGQKCDVLLVPDSIIAREKTTLALTMFAKLHKKDSHRLRLIVDEAHRYKTPESKRTVALLGKNLDAHQGIVAHFDHVLFLSGTPMPNRPRELFSILRRCARETIDGREFFGFAMRYCAAHKDYFGHWDFNGVSNLKELSSAVKASFMLRLKKHQVLTELEPKSEKIILLGDNLPASLAKADAALLREHSPEDLLEHLAPNKHLATYRRKLGEYKTARALEYITECLEREPDRSVLVFAIHKDVIAKLNGALKEYEPVTITGATPQKEREKLVHDFTTNKLKRLFIGNIQACGVGLNLQKASRVIFVEFSWVPSENEQAGDRAHRMGQTEIVEIDYLVYRNSIDRKVIETILKKERSTKQI